MVKMMGWKLLPKELQVAIANAPFSKFARSLGKLSRSLARQRCAEQVRRLLRRLALTAFHGAFEVLIFGATCEISVERDSAFAELTWRDQGEAEDEEGNVYESAAELPSLINNIRKDPEAFRKLYAVWDEIGFKYFEQRRSRVLKITKHGDLITATGFRPKPLIIECEVSCAHLRRRLLEIRADADRKYRQELRDRERRYVPSRSDSRSP